MLNRRRVVAGVAGGGGVALLILWGQVVAPALTRNTKHKGERIMMDQIVSNHFSGIMELRAKVRETMSLEAMNADIPAFAYRLRAEVVSPCPVDFQQAHRRYGEAWTRFGDGLAQAKAEQAPRILKIVRNLVTESDQPAWRAEDPLANQADGVRAAWRNLKSTAARHGVNAFLPVENPSAHWGFGEGGSQ